MSGYEGRYLVSDLGSVATLHGPAARYLTRAVTRSGYVKVTLSLNGHVVTKLAHTLVLESFVAPRPPGMEVAHWNGVRDDNRVGNLRWATRRENFRDKKRHGTQHQGTQIRSARLTETDVREIRRLGSQGLSDSMIAERFSVTRRAVHYARTGKTWAHVV